MLARDEAVQGLGKGPGGHKGEVHRVLCSHFQQGVLGGTRAQGLGALSWVH